MNPEDEFVKEESRVRFQAHPCEARHQAWTAQNMWKFLQYYITGCTTPKLT